ELARGGHDVHVVSSPSPASSSPEVHGSLRIHRAGGALATIRNSIARSVAPGVGGARAGRGGGFLRRLHDATWKNLYWPDYAAGWRRPAHKVAARLVDERRVDVMVSVSPPFTGHRVALPIRRARRRLTWLADFGDPFSVTTLSAPNNLGLYAGRNRRAEQAVVATADVLTTVNHPLVSMWADAFPEARAKMHVVPPLFAPVEPAAEPFLGSSTRTRLLYTGALHPGGRPTALLSLFDALQKATGDAYELHFIGETWPVRHDFDAHATRLGRDVFVHGPQPRDVAARAVSEAEVLVNVGYDSPIATPTKLFDYFATGKPVLNVARVWPDAATPYLERYSGAFTIGSDEVGPSSPRWGALLEFLSARRSTTPPVWLADHSPAAIASRYERLLEDALA
ncbi:MAG TPA: hypothetical protein VGB18_02570, partial [Candidatus Thermoplasmatota archaeon]